MRWPVRARTMPGRPLSDRCTRLLATRLSSICSTISARDRSFGFFPLGRIVFLQRRRTPQRQYGHGLGVGFVDVLLPRPLRPAGVDRVCRPCTKRGRRWPRRPWLNVPADAAWFRPLVKNVLAADGLDLALFCRAEWPRLHGRIRSAAGPRSQSCRPPHADRATHGPARVKSSNWVQSVCRWEKWRNWWLFKKSPRPVRTSAREELQVALLRTRPGLRSLEHFHEAHGFEVGLQQAEHQQELGWIARPAPRCRVGPPGPVPNGAAPAVPRGCPGLCRAAGRAGPGSPGCRAGALPGD